MSTLAQRSFAGGELTPSLYARTDIAKYITSLRTCRNYYILKHGGAKSRSGTQFIGEVSDSTASVKLIPFIFSNEQSYILEFGVTYIRFVRNGAYITETAQNITGITNANPGVVTINSHGYSNGDEVAISGVGGMTELNGRNFKVNNVTANTFELQDMSGTDFDTTSLGTYTSGGTAAKIYEVSTSFSINATTPFKYVQSADVFSFVFAGTVWELKRFGDANWTLDNVDSSRTIPSADAFYEDIALSGESISPGPTGLPTKRYGVTAVDRVTGREGLLHTDSFANNNATPSGGSPNVLSWTTNNNASYYKVYVFDGLTGFSLLGEVVATSSTTSFTDDGSATPQYDHLSPPAHSGDGFYSSSLDLGWSVITDTTTGSGDTFRPDAITYYQQRLVLADGETVKLSEIGNFKQFEPSGSRTTTASSPVTFSLAGRQVNNIKHLLDLNGLVMLTTGSEIVAQGDTAGTVTPTDINLRTQSYNGSSDVVPIIIDNVALYVQERGAIVRDFQFSDSINGYSGSDLTIFATHLFDGFDIDDWTYQKVPNSTVWAVRNDGTLLGLTYLREHQVLAWHKHDFDGGVVESVSAIPEGDEDILYLSIKRTIDGVTKRYVERMSTAQIGDVEDLTRMDSFLSFDGTNTTATTMTLSGGTTWAYDETITLTASASYFSSDDVGKQIHITGTDGTIIRFTIEGYTSGTVVTGKPNLTVPVAMRNTAFTTWALALKDVTGLWHIEGKDVSVFGDGYVVASPYNDSYDVLTVSDGSITLDKHYAVIHVGLPFICDIETLDIDTSQGETARDKKHIVHQANIFVEDTRGLWVGPKPPSDDDTDPLEDLYEIKLRDTESQNEPIELKTEVVDVKIKSEWNSNGRVFIRQVDPVPSTILSIMPEGNFTLR